MSFWWWEKMLLLVVEASKKYHEKPINYCVTKKNLAFNCESCESCFTFTTFFLVCCIILFIPRLRLTQREGDKCLAITLRLVWGMKKHIVYMGREKRPENCKENCKVGEKWVINKKLTSRLSSRHKIRQPTHTQFINRNLFERQKRFILRQIFPYFVFFQAPFEERKKQTRDKNIKVSKLNKICGGSSLKCSYL